ncbi:putative NADH-flavin reductase [Sinorhizobium kostiense]|uniref:NADH-flavin reductase n=1 Tax=Sinorhizobium kostiense TaxID=76747 RepID=A0ABS4R0X9_9HYPH|nr:MULTISPECIES: SDR family oxidoreductase [Sinorhizobium]MBP2236563.1 putative NADH-flavin reductase [Sinorhizobium kostiense]
MKIALFGSTGPTGKYIIEEGLRRGYELSAYTREAAKLSDYASKIEIITGDLKNREAIRRTITGSDAVISALGPNGAKTQEPRPVMNGLRNVISVMDELNIRRLIQVSTASYRDPKDGFDLKSKALVMLFKVIARSSYDDIKATGELIAGSGLDWTLVRIPFLKEGPVDGGLAVGSYGRTKLGMKLSRGHLAKFLFDQVSNREFVRAAPGIADHS